MKKLIALILAAVMCLSLLPVMTFAAEAQLPPVTNPVVGKTYKFGMIQVNTGKTEYIDGGINNDRFLTTTTDKASALDVLVESAGDGYKLAVTIDGAKLYIAMSLNGEGKACLAYTAEGTVLKYDATLNYWYAPLDGTDYYIGSYQSFDTMSASKTTYTSVDKAGVSQFHAGLFEKDSVDEPIEKPEVQLPPVTNPVVGKTYKFGMIQVNTGKTEYIDGGINNDRFLTTTTDKASALDVLVESAGDGYKLAVTIDGAKLYIAMSLNGEGKACLAYTAEGTVLKYDATLNYWYAPLDGTDYYIGSYQTFDTMSASKTSYTSVDKAGVSQFHAGLFEKDADEHTHDYVAGQTTVKNHRYHTVSYTCACGDSKTEDALHTYSATGYCSVCKYQYAPKATVSITEAIAIAGTDGNYTTDLYAITGVVTSITDTQFGNLYIKDAAGKELYIYGLFMPYNGDRFDKMTIQPKVGDTITVHAVLGSYNGVPQAKNAWLMEIKAPEAPETTKPAGTPTETTKPAGTPTETTKPAGTPTETTKPAGTPTETTKPAGTPTETTKPAEGTDEAGKIVDTAYELEVGAKLPYESTLTGKITKIDTVYSEQYKNITVTIAIKGREDKPIMCFRLKGEQAAGLAVGDTITVTGTLMNYNGTIEFDAGCKLGEVIKNNVPPTGDSTIIAPVALLMALSCTGLAVLTLGKKKFF